MCCLLYRPLLRITLAFLLGLSSHICSAEKIPLIFDTDMAIDDWSALLLLAKHPDIELVAVTANGAGETRCGPAMENIPKLLDISTNSDVRFACGDNFPMDGYFAFPEPWRKQADTLSGVALPASKRMAEKMHAVDLLHEVISKSEKKLVLVATGSLTNIAQWLEKYPDDRKKISRFVIMGGAFDVPGNIIVPGFTDNHPNKHAEWNMFVDAKAAKLVFASGMPIEVVGLDVTNQVKVTTEFAQAFKATVASPAADFWDKVLDDNDWFIDSGEYYFWDVLAALVAIDARYCEGKFESVDVGYEISDTPWQPSALKSIPSTLESEPLKQRNHLEADTAGVTRVGGTNPRVKVCRKTKPEKAFRTFTEVLNL